MGEFYKSGQPCKHKTCFFHQKTPCDYCGRIACNGDVKITKNEERDFN